MASVKIPNRNRHFCRYSMVLILMIVNDIHSQQETMSDMMQSFKDKQEKDINEIKDTMSNMMKSFEAKQENEINRIKDTVKDISQSLKNVSDLLDRTRKELGRTFKNSVRVLKTEGVNITMCVEERAQDRKSA